MYCKACTSPSNNVNCWNYTLGLFQYPKAIKGSIDADIQRIFFAEMCITGIYRLYSRGGLPEKSAITALAPSK